LELLTVMLGAVCVVDGVDGAALVVPPLPPPPPQAVNKMAEEMVVPRIIFVERSFMYPYLKY
jgi:hypothetical protein